MRFEPEWREILREPVTDEEAHQLLNRLATQADFGEDAATIAAICEATGSTPSLISRIL